MPRYRTTLPMTFLPSPHYESSEVSFRGWPLDHLALEPIDDEAKRIAAFYTDHKDGGELPQTPYINGELTLPLLGLPRWRLGQSIRDKEAKAHPEDRILMKALGHRAMGASRPSHGVFTSDRWPDADVEPMNEQARMVAAFVASWTGATLVGRAWDNDKHCIIEPKAEAA